MLVSSLSLPSRIDSIHQLASPRPSKLPVKGEEQVVDIELDKETVFLPAKTNYVAVNAKEHWQRETGVDPADSAVSYNLTNEAAMSPSSFSKNISETAKPPTAAPAEIGYPVVLRELLPSFPMTLEGQNNFPGLFLNLTVS